MDSMHVTRFQPKTQLRKSKPLLLNIDPEVSYDKQSNNSDNNNELSNTGNDIEIEEWDRFEELEGHRDKAFNHMFSTHTRDREVVPKLIYLLFFHSSMAKAINKLFILFSIF